MTAKDAEPKRDVHVDQVVGNDCRSKHRCCLPESELSATAGKTEELATPAPVSADKDKRTQDGSDPDGQHKPGH